MCNRQGRVVRERERADRRVVSWREMSTPSDPTTGATQALDAFALLGLKLTFVGAANSSPRVRAGDLCLVSYRGRLGSADGEVFDESAADAPLRVRAGRQQVIAAWDVALLHMTVGQTA